MMNSRLQGYNVNQILFLEELTDIELSEMAEIKMEDSGPDGELKEN